MAKWTLDRPGSWDYRSLGFTATDGDVLEADYAPDGFWSAADPAATETVQRYMSPVDVTPYSEPDDGTPLVWDNATNAYVPSPLPFSATVGEAQAAVVEAQAAQTGAEAARDAAQSFKHGISAKEFGAVGNGTTDDSANLRTAFTTSATLGATIYLPEGIFLIREEASTFGCLNLPSGVKLYGPGTFKVDVASVRNLPAPPAAPGTKASVRPIVIDGKSNIRIDGITIDLDGFGVQGVHGIYINDSTDIRITGVKINNSGNGGIMLSGATTKVTIRDCDMVTVQNGITFYGDKTGNPCAIDDVLIDNCRVISGIQAIDSEPVGGFAKNVRIKASHLETTGDNYAVTMSGVQEGSPDGQPNERWSLIDCTIIGAIWAVHLKYSIISRCDIDASASVTKNAIHGFFDSDGITVSHNTRIKAAPGMDGIALALSLGVRPRNWQITHNVIEVTGAAARGVRLDSPGPTKVANNRITGENSNTGIRANASAGDMESVSVHDNIVDGFIVGIEHRLTSTFVAKQIINHDNMVTNTQAVPTATTGILFTGTAAQFQNTVLHGNNIAPVYATAYSLGSVLIREGSSSPATFSGTGSPEGVVTANIGALYKRRDGAAGSCWYGKESGSGNTGWVALVTGGARTATTAALNSITNVVNTSNKVTGSVVWNSSTHKPVTAGGSAAGDVWYDATGTVAHTPV